MMAAPLERKPLRIGVFYENVQFTDLATLDILGNLSTSFITQMTQIEPKIAELAQFATDMEFLYISSTLEPAWATPFMYIKPTHTYATAPKDLDILVIGGPNPMTVPDESLQYLREASKETKVFLSICTGGMWLARSGVLDGRKATTNITLRQKAKEVLPRVQWLDQRWVVDEGRDGEVEIWTAGGAGCGIDMAIQYVYKTFPKPIVDLALAGLEFDVVGRGQFYSEELIAVQ